MRLLFRLLLYIKVIRHLKRCKTWKIAFSTIISGGQGIEIGKDVYIGYGCWLAANVSNRATSLLIDDGASIGRYAHIYSTNRIYIGRYALLAEKVYISDNLHGYCNIHMPIKDQPLVQCKEVVIGEGCWIGENVCIIGASVGKNSVVGANSVVTHDIPDYSVAVGAPAKVIKRYDAISKKWINVNSSIEEKI